MLLYFFKLLNINDIFTIIDVHRDQEQIFTWNTMESPGNILTHGYDPKYYDNFYNYTRSHRRDADIFTPYGSRESLIKTVEFGKEEVNRILKKKSKLAVSNILINDVVV